MAHFVPFPPCCLEGEVLIENPQRAPTFWGNEEAEMSHSPFLLLLGVCQQELRPSHLADRSLLLLAASLRYQPCSQTGRWSLDHLERDGIPAYHKELISGRSRSLWKLQRAGRRRQWLFRVVHWLRLAKGHRTVIQQEPTPQMGRCGPFPGRVALE